MSQTLDFGITAEQFSVDLQRRTMTGLVVPWGRVGRHRNGRKWRFSRGSLVFGHEKYIRLNDEHVQSARLGRGTGAEDTDAGLVLTFKVYDGPAGDRALAQAQQGTKTGFSVEIEFDESDSRADPENPGVLLVDMANLDAVAFVRNPAFNDARLISVRAGADQGVSMECTSCGLVHADGVTECATPPAPPAPPAAAPSVTLTAEQFSALMGNRPDPAPPVRPVVDPTTGAGRTPPAVVREPVSYRFSREGDGKYNFSRETEFDFSTDIMTMIKSRVEGRDYSAPLARVDDFIKSTFADVDTADLPGTLPSVRRPDMWVPQLDYPTPLWDLCGRGPTPEGGLKFDIPKFTSSSGLVGVATQNTEPAGGTFVDELQTITPGQLWGKVEVTRQAWRQGGNPAFSGILWEQFLREFYEDREAVIATFLGTLTAATDIALTGTDSSPSNDEYQATIESFEQAYADLLFVRGGNRFSAFAVHQALYRVGSRVKDDNGRPLYPMINPQNANGTTASKYKTLDIAGSTWVPAYALGTPANASTNSWLFDPAVVLAWANAPERLFWDFGATIQTANVPNLSFVTIGLYADYAVGNTDITGVRQVTFDPNTEA
jgi:HK97 family phage prohead protease